MGAGCAAAGGTARTHSDLGELPQTAPLAPTPDLGEPPLAERSPEELRTFLNKELKLCQINHLFSDRILLQLETRICHRQPLPLLQQENRWRRACVHELWTRSLDKSNFWHLGVSCAEVSRRIISLL